MSSVEVLKAYSPREDCNVFFQLPHADGIWQVNAHMNAVCRDMPGQEPNEWLQSARDKETKVVCFPEGLWTKEEFLNGVAYLVREEVPDEIDLNDYATLVSLLTFFSYICHENYILVLTRSILYMLEHTPLEREEFLLVFHYAHLRKEKELLALLGYSALTTVHDPPLPDDVWGALGMDHVSAVVSHVAKGVHSKLDKVDQMLCNDASRSSVRLWVLDIANQLVALEEGTQRKKRKAEEDDIEPGSKGRLTE